MTTAHPFSEPWSRAYDELALEDRKTISVGVRISSEPARSSGMFGAPLALERAERAGHRPLGGVVDQHDREQELVPRPDETAGSPATRSPAGQRHVDPPEQLPRRAPSTRAASDSSVGMLTKCARIQKTRERHVQADERQDDRPAGVEQPESADQVVERDDDARERQRQPEQEQDEQRVRQPGTRRWPMAKPAIVAMTTETGTTPSTMSTLERAARPCCACSKASTKLPHCGSAGQASPWGTVPERLQRRREQAHERQERDRPSGRSGAPARPDARGG